MWRIAADTKAYEPIDVNRRAENRLMSTFEIRGANGGGVSRLTKNTRCSGSLQAFVSSEHPVFGAT
jgi:hypothetical protein